MNGKMKRILSCFLVVVMALTAVPLGSLAGIELPALFSTGADAAWDGYFKYAIINGEAHITNCNTDLSGDVLIPATYDGCPVTCISPYALSDCRKVESITLPDSVKYICEEAFEFCISLKSIDLGSGVIEIGENAFDRCKSLTEITIPESVTALSAGAFYGCTSLKRITLPDSLTDIGVGAFMDTAWYDEQPYGPVYAGKVLYGYKGTMPQNTTITVKDGTKGIAGCAFFNMGNLTGISLPDSVVTVSSRAFDGCSGLKSIRLGKNVETIGETAFNGCSSLLNITVPEKVTRIEKETFQDCRLLVSVSLPKGLTGIGERAFSNCRNLTSITIPESVTEISYSAFYRCMSLPYIKLPEKLTEIKASTFYGCSALRYMHIPDGVTSIEGSAFAGCNHLTDIVIPDSVTELGDSAFRACTRLKNVTVGSGVETIRNSAFYQCKSLSTIRLGIGVNTIKADAFKEIADFPNVYYAGSAIDWKNISIHESNDMLLRGKIEYNRDLSHAHSYETVILSKATPTQDGGYVKLCRVCSAEYSSGIIYKASSAVLSGTKYLYDGKVKTPAVTVKDSKGRTLKNGRDYTLTYSSGRKNVGKYAVRIDFTGNYSGRTYLYFTILPGVTSKLDATQSTSAVKLTWKAVPGATGYRVFLYNAKTKKYTKLADTKSVSYTVSKLQAGTDYKFAVRAYTTVGNSVFWADSYKTVTTATKPGTSSLTVAAGSKKATLKWTKQTGATGYVVYMATSQNGTYSRVAVVKGGSSVSYVKTGLSTGRTYYFKVAAYKTAGGKNIYSGFSAVKGVKVK